MICVMSTASLNWFLQFSMEEAHCIFNDIRRIMVSQDALCPRLAVRKNKGLFSFIQGHQYSIGQIMVTRAQNEIVK